MEIQLIFFIKHYAGNFVYENNTLKQFYHPEGYVEPDGSGGYSYNYQYKDIWGNTRLTYTDTDGNGSIAQNEIKREQNYYPFGLEHQGYNTYKFGVENNLKTYQGQEFTKDLDLNTHEWKFRMSDPSIGRFWQIDPLAEKFYYNSTYAFQENKLGSGIELEGLENLEWEDQQFLEMSKEFQGVLAWMGSGIDKFFASFTTKTTKKVAGAGNGTVSGETTVEHTEKTTVRTNLENFINNVQVGENGEAIMPSTPMVSVDKKATTTVNNKAKLTVSLRGPIKVTEELKTQTDTKTKKTSVIGDIKVGVLADGNSAGLFLSGETSSDGTTVKAGAQATVKNGNTSTSLKVGISHKFDEKKNP